MSLSSEAVTSSCESGEKAKGADWHGMTCWEEMNYLRYLLHLLIKLNSYNSLAQQLRDTKHLTCIHKVLGSNSVDLIPLSVGSVKYNKQSLLSPTVNVARFSLIPRLLHCFLSHIVQYTTKAGEESGNEAG